MTMSRHLYDIQKALANSGIYILGLDLRKSLALLLEWISERYNYHPCIVTGAARTSETQDVGLPYPAHFGCQSASNVFYLNAFQDTTFSFNNQKRYYYQVLLLFPTHFFEASFKVNSFLMLKKFLPLLFMHFFSLRSISCRNEKLKPAVHQFANINICQMIISIFLVLAHAAYTMNNKVKCCIHLEA